MISNIFFILMMCGAAYCAIRISVADFRARIIPDIYLFPLLLIGLVTVAFFPWACTMGDAVVAAAGGYALSAGIGALFARMGRDAPIGLGDVKLIATGGIWLGTAGLAVALVISCLAGIVWGALRRQRYIPFGPFFIIGGILTLIAGIFLL